MWANKDELEGNKQRIANWAKLVLKVTLSALALYIVSRKIDVKETLSVIRSVQVWYLTIAAISIIISHILSAFRLNIFFRCIGIEISTLQNLKLYWIGLFYNLFLPGGIGGDAYKVIILKQNKDVTTKKLISATILDRISGLVALFCLTVCMLLLSSATKYLENTRWTYLLLILIPLSYTGFYVVLKVLMKYFLPAFHLTNIISWGKQIFQVMGAFFILKSLYIDAYFMDYLSLFMISSVVAIAPISIGGVGLRELAFVYAYQYFMIEKNTAIAFTLLFFTTTAFTSFIGAFINLDLKKDEDSQTD